MGSTVLTGPAMRGEQGWRGDTAVKRIVTAVLAATLRRFPDLRSEALSITLVLLNRRTPIGYAYRGDQLTYPASLVKLFYLVAAQAWLEAGRIARPAELEGALPAMIRQSSNDATAHVLDLLTRTTGGPALSPKAFSSWLSRRRAVNRYFARWGCPEFSHINLTQKTWSQGPYGREEESLALPGNRNRLSSDAVARLLLAIARGEAVSRKRSAAMRNLMERSTTGNDDKANPMNQVIGFLGEGLPAGSRLWSKAGWMSSVRHDGAIVRLPDGTRFVLVVFSRGMAQAQNRRLLPFIARQVVRRVGGRTQARKRRK